MQFRSKYLVGTIAALLILVMSPAAFGQINLTIQYSSSPKEIQTNRSAYTADPDSQAALTVIASLSSTSIPITATTLIIDYPAIITTGRAAATGATPAGFVGPNNPIGTDAVAGATENTGVGFAGVNLQITNASGLFAGASTPIITTVNYATGQVYIMLPFNGGPGAFATAGFGPAGGGQTGGAFRLENVRIDANGLTAPAVATATLASSAAGYQIISGTSGNVIDALAAGIGTVDQGTTTDTGVIFIGQTTPADTTFTLRVNEGFASAWFDGTGPGDFFDTTNSRDTELRLTFTGIPVGVTITLTGATTNGGTASFTPSTVTSADNVVTVTWTGTQLSRIDSNRLTVSGVIGTLTTSAAAALTGGSISVTVSMAPVGTGNIAAVTGGLPMIPDQTQPIPRFAAAEVGPYTVATITAAKTTLLLPYVVSIKSISYDTGLTVANTSKDPFGATGGAAASTGNLVFHFFPRTATGAGTAISYATSATNLPGTGLDASGNLAAGGLWSGLLSEVWSS